MHFDFLFWALWGLYSMATGMQFFPRLYFWTAVVWLGDHFHTTFLPLTFTHGSDCLSSYSGWITDYVTSLWNCIESVRWGWIKVIAYIHTYIIRSYFSVKIKAWGMSHVEYKMMLFCVHSMCSEQISIQTLYQGVQDIWTWTWLRHSNSSWASHIF